MKTLLAITLLSFTAIGMYVSERDIQTCIQNTGWSHSRCAMELGG